MQAKYEYRHIDKARVVSVRITQGIFFIFGEKGNEMIENK